MGYFGEMLSGNGWGDKRRKEVERWIVEGELGMGWGLNRDFQDGNRMGGMEAGIILNIRFSSWRS
jgi:hypothetical protein